MSNITQKKRVSCLGALLIACMLLIAVCTVSVNLLFRGNNAPSILGKRYCYYTADDMGDRIPAGEVVIAEKADQVNTQDIVLYRTDSGEYRIAVASLIVETSSNVPEQSSAAYYLTTVTNTTAIEVDGENIVGICRQRSPQLGVFVGFLTSTLGILLGLVLPCVILALYLIAVLVRSREDKNDLADDEDTDLAFVKSIQKKQQQIAERDAERLAAQEQSDPNDPPRRLSDEEFEQQEEEEAARRAERIAAVRSHMEQRRQTETPDGVPLYTTEIITKTHTLQIQHADKPLTTQQPAVRPAATGSIPRLTATGHIQIPTEEQLAQEQRERQEQEARLNAARELARAAQEAHFAQPAPIAEPEAPAVTPEPPAEPEIPQSAVPIAETPAAAPEPAAPADASETAAAAPEPAAPAAQPVRKPKIASASFGDLMAFLDGEQKKLK